MEGVNLFAVLTMDAMHNTINKKGEQETLKIIKRISISEDLRKVYLKAYFQEVHRREK